jgi:hypothetical protein
LVVTRPAPRAIQYYRDAQGSWRANASGDALFQLM